MAAYNGRTGPNFSQYLNNLNTIPTGYEQDVLGTDEVNLDQELAMFTNADFTDFDALGGGFPNDPSINFGLNDGPQPNVENGSDIKYEELLSGEPNHFMSTYGPSMQPVPQQHASYAQSQTASPSNSSSPPSAQSAKTGSKRKQDAAQIVMEEQSRVAAEEDKRRRNTAASARFRVKKKQREAALEENVKAMTDKNDKLQSKIEQLERENQWLKNLVTEKKGNQSEKDISDLYQKFRRESEEADSIVSAHKDGVGTA